MSDISEIVDVLENRISKLLHKLELYKQANGKLQEQVATLENQKVQLEHEVADWKEKYESLKLASSILGSNEKKEAKLKINALIRELDECISQLAE